MAEVYKCAECGGSGTLLAFGDYVSCPECDGSGFIDSEDE